MVKIDLNGSIHERNHNGIDGVVLCAPTFAHDNVIREAADNMISVYDLFFKCKMASS